MTETPFALRTAHTPERAVIYVVGELDMGTVPSLEAAVQLAQETAPRVVVDLREATFLDSSALNTLVRFHRQLGARQVEFRIVTPADHAVRRIFEIARLTEVLPLVDSPDAGT